MHEVFELVENQTDSDLMLVIEPWGDELSIEPGRKRLVRFRAPNPGFPDVDRTPGRVTIFAWPGATATVPDGGRSLRDYPIAVPQLPPGMAVRDFMHSVGLAGPSSHRPEANQQPPTSANRYFERRWEEPRGDAHDDWGPSTWFFETDEQGYVLRQLEVYDDGPRLQYTKAQMEDAYGGLAEGALDLLEFAAWEIEAARFELAWAVPPKAPAEAG